jgi:type VI secretion system secreted protein Hcp
MSIIKLNNFTSSITLKHILFSLFYILIGLIIASLIFFTSPYAKSDVIPMPIPGPIANSCYLGEDTVPCTYLCPANCPEPRAVGAYLKISEIKGESDHSHHPEEIEVLTWSWGMSQSDNESSGRGKDQTKAQEMVVTKYMDIASPKLMKAVADSTKFDDAWLKVHAEMVSSTELDYIIIHMQDVVVTSYKVNHSSSDRPTETITLRFSKVKTTYTDPSDPDESEEFEWDFKKNKAG